MKKLCNVLVALGAMAIAAPASANPITCITNSNNLEFRFGGQTNEASSWAVETCKQNPFTSNTECVNNLRCGFWQQMPRVDVNVQCTTQSRNLPFGRVGRSHEINAISTATVQECKNNRYTSNQECLWNLVCQYQDPQPFPPQPPVPPMPPQPPFPPQPQPPFPPQPAPLPPQPAPWPPAPVPGPMPGNWECDLRTPTGGYYPGYGPTSDHAAVNARNLCLSHEAAQTCNRGGGMTCRRL